MFDNNGFALEDCWVRVYNFNKVTRVFEGVSEEYLVGGSGIPANSTLSIPNPPRIGFTQIFTECNEWVYVLDLRGVRAYNVLTGDIVKVDYVGILKDQHVFSFPYTSDDDVVGIDVNSKSLENCNMSLYQLIMDMENTINSLTKNLLDTQQQLLDAKKRLVYLHDYSKIFKDSGKMGNR